MAYDLHAALSIQPFNVLLAFVKLQRSKAFSILQQQFCEHFDLKRTF
jgi:hypothetical protein